MLAPHNSSLQEYKLGAVGIFTHAAREMAKRRHYDQMRQIVDCVVKIGMGSDETIDEIVGACLLVIADNPSEVILLYIDSLSVCNC